MQVKRILTRQLIIVMFDNANTCMVSDNEVNHTCMFMRNATLLYKLK